MERRRYIWKLYSFSYEKMKINQYQLVMWRRQIAQRRHTHQPLKPCYRKNHLADVEVKPAKGRETSDLSILKHTEEKILHFTFLPNTDLYLTTALKLPRATAAPAIRSLMASPISLKQNSYSKSKETAQRMNVFIFFHFQPLNSSS